MPALRYLVRLSPELGSENRKGSHGAERVRKSCKCGVACVRESGEARHG